MAQQANCSLTLHTEPDLRLPAGVPGLHVSLRDLHERNYLHFRISQKRFGRGVFTFQVAEPLDSSPRSGSVTRQPRRQLSGQAHSAFQWLVESKRYRRWKVCRTRDEQPISGGEYSLSGREQFVRQRLYPNVTI
jgi:hypothetical protein